MSGMTAGLGLALLLSLTAGAKPTDAERAKQKAEKKLEAFTKEYDPAKNLSRKGAELERDIADLDKELAALATVDSAAATELQARRDAAVAAAKQAVGGALASKATEDLDKKFERASKDLDPEKKNLLNVDPRQLERTRKELDELIAKLDPAARAPYEVKRDALFAAVDKAVAGAKVDKLRATVPTTRERVAPAAGVEAIAPMKPTWCDGVLEGMGDRMRSFMPGLPERFDGQLTTSIIFSCIDPDFEPRQQAVASYRQTMSNELGLTAAMNERLMKLGAKLVVLEDDKPQLKAFCETQLKPLTEGTAGARANRALERIAVSCGNRLSNENKMRMLDIDTPGGLTSQLAAAAVILARLEQPASGGNASYQLAKASDVAVMSTIALDPAEFERQLDGLALNETGQARAIVAYFRARSRVAGFAAAYRDLGKRIPGLEKLVFDAPAAAAKKYLATQAATDKPVLELVLAMEAQAGSGLKGCAQKLWPFLKQELKGQEKTKLNDVHLNGLLAFALTQCARRDSEVPGMEAVFSYFAEHTPAVRGPLTAAYLGYLEAYNELSSGAKNGGFDPARNTGRGDAPLSLPRPDRNPMGDGELGASVFGHANSMNPGSANEGSVVAATERHGDLVKVTFRTEKSIVPDYSCVDTNKIDRILPDGTVVYRSICTKVGEHEASSTRSPVEIPAWAAGGIVPGGLLIAYGMSDSSSAKGRAWVLEAYDTKARGKRTSLFGVEP